MPYHATERTEARRVAVRDRIAGCAATLLTAGGYAAVSIDDVARGAGVATGTVYRHFSSKADLLADVFARAAERELAIAHEVVERGNPAAERLARAVEVFARRALAAPTLAYALVAEPVDPVVEEQRLAFRRGYRDLLAGVLEEGVRDGELAPLEIETTAAALVGAIGEALVGPLSPAVPARPEALVAALVSFCLNAINAREAAHVGA